VNENFTEVLFLFGGSIVAIVNSENWMIAGPSQMMVLFFISKTKVPPF
jgi:hypothetical protein